jgi:hypothetical protein
MVLKEYVHYLPHGLMDVCQFRFVRLTPHVPRLLSNFNTLVSMTRMITCIRLV